MQTEIISRLLDEAKLMKTSDYTDEMVTAIVEAANSENHFLNEKAWLTVHSSLAAYENDFLKKFGVYRNSQDYEDYVSELFLVIVTDLNKWKPELGAITTHFKNRFMKACISQRNKNNSTFSSTHYENVHADIKKAISALEQEGIYNPSTIEIRNYLASTKKVYSEQTLLNCLAQIREISSIDTGINVADNSEYDPEKRILEKEKSEDILNCIRSLEPQYRAIMEIEYLIYKTEGKEKRKVTNKLLADEFRKRIGPASDEWIKNLRDAAERDFQHRYNKRRYHNNAQVNMTSYIPTDDLLISDIESAIASDMNAFFS